MRVYRHLLALQPGDNDAAKASIVADTAMARLWLRQSKPFKALTMLNSAAREAARLCTTMKDDRTCDEDRTLLLATQSQARIQVGDLSGAALSAHQASDLAQALENASGPPSLWRRFVCGSARLALLRVKLDSARTPSDRRVISASIGKEAAAAADLARRYPLNTHLAELSGDAERALRSLPWSKNPLS